MVHFKKYNYKIQKYKIQNKVQNTKKDQGNQCRPPGFHNIRFLQHFSFRDILITVTFEF